MGALLRKLCSPWNVRAWPSGLRIPAGTARLPGLLAGGPDGPQPLGSLGPCRPVAPLGLGAAFTPGIWHQPGENRGWVYNLPAGLRATTDFHSSCFTDG